MIKKFFSNLNTVQRVFVFIPIVLVVTILCEPFAVNQSNNLGRFFSTLDFFIRNGTR